MDDLIIPEIGKTFFIDDAEYIVGFIINEKKRFTADLYSKIKIKDIPRVGNKFMIDSTNYIITYINFSKNRITAKPISIGY